MKNKRMKATINGVYKIDLDSPAVKNGYIGELGGYYGYKRKNPTKTFYGGLTIGILSTLAVLYILIPIFDWANDTLLAYFMK